MLAEAEERCRLSLIPVRSVNLPRDRTDSETACWILAVLEHALVQNLLKADGSVFVSEVINFLLL